MTKESIKNKVDSLPPDKVNTVGEFIDFILHKSHEELTSEQFITLQMDSDSFDFLISEPDLYSYKNIREKYN